VQDGVAVATLQRQADPLGDPETISGGRTNSPIRKNQVMSLIDMCSLIAMMSLPAANMRTE
jgi:hypothetical protein